MTTLIPPLPTPVPQSNDPQNFDARADLLLSALPGFVAAANMQAGENNELHADVVQGAFSAKNAADLAVAAIGASKFDPATTYPSGVLAWSPVNGKVYRRRTAGKSAADPSADAANWIVLALDAAVLGAALQVVLTGLVTNNAVGITAADTVLQALGKLQAQLALQASIGSSPDFYGPKITYRIIFDRPDGGLSYAVLRRAVPDLSVDTEVGRIVFGRGSSDAEWGSDKALGSIRCSHKASGALMIIQAIGSVSPTLTLTAGDAAAGSSESVTLTGIHSNTTASAANMFVAANGLLSRSTSSLKYKTSIEDVDAALMQRVIDEARPIWYRSTCAADNPGHSWWGLGAEELGEIDPRFVHWAHPSKTVERVELEEVDESTGELHEDGSHIKRRVTKEARYSEQVPDTDAPQQAEGVMYERLVVPLLWKVQQMQQQMHDMQTRIAALGGAK